MVVGLGCNAGKETAVEPPKETPPQLTPAADLPHANEGTLIRGTVVGIFPPTDQYESRNPCGEVPCRATVRVDEVVREGNGPASRLKEGEEVPMLFRFSLAPSNTGLFPQLRVDYPGLTEQNRFEAVVDGRGGQWNHPIHDRSLLEIGRITDGYEKDSCSADDPCRIGIVVFQ